LGGSIWPDAVLVGTQGRAIDEEVVTAT